MTTKQVEMLQRMYGKRDELNAKIAEGRNRCLQLETRLDRLRSKIEKLRELRDTLNSIECWMYGVPICKTQWNVRSYFLFSPACLRKAHLFLNAHNETTWGVVVQEKVQRGEGEALTDDRWIGGHSLGNDFTHDTARILAINWIACGNLPEGKSD